MKKIIFSVVGMAFVLTAGLVTAEKIQEQTLNRAIIKIDSITCGGCLSSINQGLSELDGFSGIGANLFRKLVAVDYAEPLTDVRILEKLEEVGYPGLLQSVESVTQKQSFAFQQSKRAGFGSGGCCSAGYAGRENNNTNTVIPSSGSCCALPAERTSPAKSL